MLVKMKFNDTRKRSFLKALTAYLLEVGADILISSGILTLLGLPPETAIIGGIGIATIIELFCLLIHYLNDRIWNKTQWGRNAKDERNKECLES